MAHSMLSEAVAIPSGSVRLDGDLHVPESAAGLVIFAHGSGSSRFSRRNRAVAKVLEHAGFATLLLDLLTAEEEADDDRTAEYRFDIALLGRRVLSAIDWAAARADVRRLPIALFGASTGAAAALVAAATRPEAVGAVVSRGGRPDLAEDALSGVEAPTLLIVGGDDTPVVGMNRDAMRALKAPADLQIIRGASHLFEEPGALEQVARLAAEWCRQHLSAPRVH